MPDCAVVLAILPLLTAQRLQCWDCVRLQVSTENAYLDSLKQTLDTYLKPMHQMSSVFSASDMDIIFLNFQELVPIHETISRRLDRGDNVGCAYDCTDILGTALSCRMAANVFLAISLRSCGGNCVALGDGMITPTLHLPNSNSHAGKSVPIADKVASSLFLLLAAC